MAKKPEPVYQISKAELKRRPRNEQRRLLDLGYVEGEDPPAEVAAKAEAKS